MKYLQDYVDGKNTWCSIFGDAAITFPLTQETINRLAKSIDCELSPENLHCDGEASMSQVRKQYAYLTTVADELKNYAISNGFSMPEMYEL